MTWLRRRWQQSNRRLRVAWIAGVVLAVGLIANLVLSPKAITYAGAFVATGPMTTPRQGATATLLADGRVLVAGGSADGKTALGSAELYDPTLGTFTLTGSMAAPRTNATAVLLPDGRVLVAGGYGSAGVATLATAELYDPRTGTFTPTGSLATARALGTMTLLGDGRVLMAGGGNDRDRFELKTTELFDPKSGTFAPTGALLTGREGAAAALLPDGQVLVAGGAISVDSNTGTFTSSAELYDPANGTFAATGSMATALEGRAATLVIDGRILLAGGRGLGNLIEGSAAAELYDPTTGMFIRTGSMGTPMAGPAAIGLADGRILVVGELGAAALYDSLRGTFSPAGAMITPRYGAMTTILGNGQVLIAGGTFGGQHPVQSAELFR
jgi:hypothetical protein